MHEMGLYILRAGKFKNILATQILKCTIPFIITIFCQSLLFDVLERSSKIDDPRKSLNSVGHYEMNTFSFN